MTHPKHRLSAPSFSCSSALAAFALATGIAGTASASTTDDGTEEPAAPAPAPVVVTGPAPASTPEPEEHPAPEAREAYVPHGFTFELGLGISQTSIQSDLASRERNATGLAPLSFGIGGFLSPKVALMFRGSGTSLFREDALNRSYQVVNGHYGPSVQVWVTDRFFVGGGVGVAILATTPFQRLARADQFTEIGFGVNGRAGWAFALAGKHAFTVSLDLYGSRTGGDRDATSSTTVATALNLGWQLR